MSYLSDLFFICIFIFILINHIIIKTTDTLVFCLFFRKLPVVLGL